MPRVLPSPAGGLRYKVLTLPGSLEVPCEDGNVKMDNDNLLVVPGEAPSGSKLRLGILPVRPECGMRTANLITRADDEFWDVSSLDQLREYAGKQWPHFPIFDLASEEELTRFAEDPGGRFPQPQYSPSAAWTPAAGASGGAAGAEAMGAVLVGDALHAFPPDLGQGVNSALQDVMVLRSVLEAEGDASPAAAAQRYAEERTPDVLALVEMMQVAAPYQYGQSAWGSKLWMGSFLARFLLNKELPHIFDLPAFRLVQHSEL